jgi:hypothetical protein
MRVVGKRQEGHGDRAGLDALVLRFGGGAPKGVYRYCTQEEANEDQERWLRERVARVAAEVTAEALRAVQGHGRDDD